MPNYTDPIPVLRGHLEEFRASLENTGDMLEAERLARRARELHENVRPSRLQTQVEQTIQRLDGYLATTEEDDERVQPE